MQRVAVVGVGQTVFSGPQTRSNTELFSEAAMEAFATSAVRRQDIQALMVGNVLSDFEEGQQIAHVFIAENLGLQHIVFRNHTVPVIWGSLVIKFFCWCNIILDKLNVFFGSYQAVISFFDVSFKLLFCCIKCNFTIFIIKRSTYDPENHGCVNWLT